MRNGAVLMLSGGLLVWGALFLRAATVPTPPTPDAAMELVRAYNGRDTGSIGWRRARVEIRAGQVLSRTFSIVNVWGRNAASSRMLFFLQQPEGLRGTRYLQIENSKPCSELDVRLLLPTADRVLQIDPAHFDEGLLGSDFSYHDLRMNLPECGWNYRLQPAGSLNGMPVSKLEATYKGNGNSPKWPRVLYYMTQDKPFLLGADYWEAKASGGAVKRMRVIRYREITRVRTAEMMEMTTADGNSTRILLEDARFHLPSPGSLTPLETDRLTEVDRALKAGWPLQIVPRGAQ